MSRRGRDAYERDELEFDRYSRRGRGPEAPRGPPPGGQMERVAERRRSRPQFNRRSSSAGPMMAPSRLGEDYEYLPRDVDRIHEHEEVHMPRGRGGRGRSRGWGPRNVGFEEEEHIRRGMEDYRLDERSGRRKFRNPEVGGELVPAGRPNRRPEQPVGRASYERRRSRPRTEIDETIYPPTGEPGDDDQIYIRRETDRSPSSSSSSSADAPTVRAPPIHQDVVTHHKHIEHGFERERERREPARRRADIDDSEIRRREERVVQRQANREPTYDQVVVRGRDNRRFSTSDLRDEAAFYNGVATENAPIGEAYHGATRNWSIVDVPPGTKRVTMDGAGGASQEISWQLYNGARRSKFEPYGDEYESEAPHPSQVQGSVARRYVGTKNKRDELWTEITKDLVTKEALEREGYEYEETESFYYVFSYMRYEDVEHLVRVSDDFRRARRDRVREIQRERAAYAEPPPRVPALPAPEPPSVMIDRGPARPRETDRVYEREVVTDDVRGPSRWSYAIDH